MRHPATKRIRPVLFQHQILVLCIVTLEFILFVMIIHIEQETNAIRLLHWLHPLQPPIGPVSQRFMDTSFSDGTN